MHCVLFAKMDEVLSFKKTKTYQKVLEKWKKILEKSPVGTRHYNLTHKAYCRQSFHYDCVFEAFVHSQSNIGCINLLYSDSEVSRIF